MLMQFVGACSLPSQELRGSFYLDKDLEWIYYYSCVHGCAIIMLVK